MNLFHNKKIPPIINSVEAQSDSEAVSAPPCVMTRRQFLLTGGLTTAVVMVGIPGLAEAQTPAMVATYERKFIAKLSELEQDVPLQFNYPDDGQYAASTLVKMGVEAGGGIGPQKDVVAFNLFCTHQGGPLHGSYKPADKALGPCPLHLTTFDLTRHGIFIAGQAYQSLPQVLLELEGDDIYAVGMFGLIYGRFDNLQA